MKERWIQFGFGWRGSAGRLHLLIGTWCVQFAIRRRAWRLGYEAIYYDGVEYRSFSGGPLFVVSWEGRPQRFR